MPTATKKPKTELAPVTHELYPIADAELTKIADEYRNLRIEGIADKGGYMQVHKARMVVKGYRVDIEKKRKELKADVLERGRAIDAEAKRLTAIIDPVEAHLEREEETYNETIEAIKREAEEARQVVYIDRVNKLAAVGFVTTTVVAAEMSHDEFCELLEAETVKHAERVKAEEEARKAKEAEEQRKRVGLTRAQELYKFGVTGDVDRLATLSETDYLIERNEAIFAHEEAKAAEKKLRDDALAEEARLQAEREKLAAERAELDRQRAEAEQAERERLAAEKAREEERARIEEEARIAKAKEEAERIAREREAALRPDREKLLAVAEAVGSIEIPEVSEEAQEVAENVAFLLASAAKGIREAIESELS